jgi:diphosphomevalonate decarboxylase
MSRSAVALAHPNIALAKYWGKSAGEGNVPAVPSLSVTLEGMTTRTEVSFDETLVKDELVLDGQQANARAEARASALVDEVRKAAGFTTRARIVSRNDFPTASGLASSASGFAALALAAVRASGLDWTVAETAALARRSSASAARSLFGGFAQLVGPDASQVAPPSALDMRVLVAVTTESAKTTSSTEGMIATQERSPYYAAWVEEAPRIFTKMRAALLAGDFDETGALAERSALAMHACAMAAGVVYVTGATLAALAEVRAMRASGLGAYATMDAGPHLKCLVRATDAASAKERLESVAGVLRVIETRPGEGARLADGGAS